MSEWSPGIQKVLRHVTRTKGWELDGGALRRIVGGVTSCPISSMERRLACEWSAVAKRQGINYAEAYKVADTADGYVWRKTSFSPALRVALLKAAKLA